jgi:serine protease Do
MLTLPTMKNLLLFPIFLLALPVLALPSNELLFKLNSSIVKVNVATKNGGHGVGSGVVVAKDHIVTNCHVVANAAGVHVTKYGHSFSPHALIADWANDLCILKFKYLELNPVKLGSNNNLNYEQEVFGKSYGGNTIKPHTVFGKVKGMHHFNNNKIIQSSAWFAMGASGGGLFNQDGELIGITTFKSAGRSAFYYSMPVEIIKSMLANGKELSVTTQPELPFWDAPDDKQPFFMQVVGPLKQENWQRLEAISSQWRNAQPKSLEAHSNYALALFKLGNIVQSEKEFKEVVQKNMHFAEGYYYLYEIAKLKEEEEDAIKYKTIVLSLDENLINE